jgi:hypothetical protein
MKRKSTKKTHPRTVTIRIDNTDFSRLSWLQAFLGGGSATSALKFALKAAYEQQRALQVRAKTSVPFSPALGVGPFSQSSVDAPMQISNLAGGSQEKQNR